MIDEYEHLVWAFGGMRIGKANWSTKRKPAPVTSCLLQMPYDLTRDQTRTSAVGCRQRTVWAMIGPSWILKTHPYVLCQPVCPWRLLKQFRRDCPGVSSGPLACHNFRGCTFYKPFYFWFYSIELISNERQQSENVLHQCKLSRFKKCDCGLVIRVSGYIYRGPGSIPDAARFSEKLWVWNGVHSASWVRMRSYLEEIVAAPV
jgi:hypothetical protein